MRRLRDLVDSEDPAVAALARLFRSLGDLDPPPGADERVCDALARNDQRGTGGIRRGGPGTVYGEHELACRSAAVEPVAGRPATAAPARRRCPVMIAAMAVAVAIVAAITAVVVRPQASDAISEAPRPDVRDAGSQVSAAPAPDSIAAIAPRPAETRAAAESPPRPASQVPAAPPAPIVPPRRPSPSHSQVASQTTWPANPPSDLAPDTPAADPAGWAAVDANIRSAAGLTSGGKLTTSPTGGLCRPGFVCVYQNSNFQGIAYGVALGAGISDLTKLQCPGCANGLHGNDDSFGAQMSSWDNETDRPYCWYPDLDFHGKPMTMPPHTKRRSVPKENNDKALSMGPC